MKVNADPDREDASSATNFSGSISGLIFFSGTWFSPTMGRGGWVVHDRCLGLDHDRAPREAFAAGVRFGTCAGHSPAGTAAAAGRGRQGIVVVSPVAGHDDGASKSCAVVSPLECGMPYGACGRVT